ncbi:MAG: polyketide synthase, partial [Gemmatimonadales bacterium]
MSHDPESPALDAAVAIVGMACRLPGAMDPDTFWQNLLDGVESIHDLDREALRAGGLDPRLLDHPDYVARGAALEGMARWDNGFFGMSPREAAIMDPQQRHFLEMSWEALERAGYAPGTFDGQVGVFAGSGPNTYMMFNILGDPTVLREQGFFLVRHIGNDKDFVATRVSYHLNLTGPGVTIQTACSTSLATVHTAIQSLLSYECDMALAGALTISFPHMEGYLYREGEILSPDGHCRAFDADSAGTVLGDGGGVVVLRRYRDAVEAGDTILGVIRGSAMNNDGSAKVGYLAPSVEGQSRVVAEALAVADVHPESIGYIEAHGTGTPVGDPIEVTALTRAFRTETDRVGYCGLGSVKTNIGHLDTGAGVAGLMKATLAVRHGVIPPSLHFRAPNPELGLEDSPFRVVAQRTEWVTEDGGPRRAGVNSLGVGGTNVHVIVEEPPVLEGDPDPRTGHLFLLSGRSRRVVERASARLVDHLETHPDDALADVAFTLQAGRNHFKERRLVVARTREEAIDALVTGDEERVEDHTADGTRRSVAFLFAGGGAQYPGMARDLYEAEPLFRREVDRGLAHLEPELRRRVEGLLELGDAPAVPEADREKPSLALPALFLVQHAQARLWMSWGVEPSAMIGHSMGEYTAACLAGVFSLEEALELVVLRGALFETVSGGGMLSVPLSEAELRPLLGDELSVAAVNGPELCVASGPRAAIAALEEALAGREIEARRIHIDVAAHSSMLEPILEPFRARFQRARLNPPTLPFASNLTGSWITAAEATDPEYWVRQLRQTVRFSDGLKELLADPDRVLLEVGPGRTLATLSRLHPDRDPGQETFTSLRHPDETVNDEIFQLRMLGRLWQRGVTVDWSGVHGGARRRRIPLPTYPFEWEEHLIRPRYRLDAAANPALTPDLGGAGVAPGEGAAGAVEATVGVGVEGVGASGASRGVGAGATGPDDAAEWLHHIRWRAAALADEPDGAAAPPLENGLVLVLAGSQEDPAEAVAIDALEKRHGEVRVVRDEPSEAALNALLDEVGMPTGILWTRSLSPAPESG